VTFFASPFQSKSPSSIGHKKTRSAIAKAGHQIHHLALAVFLKRPQADLKSAQGQA